MATASSSTPPVRSMDQPQDETTEMSSTMAERARPSTDLSSDPPRSTALTSDDSQPTAPTSIALAFRPRNTSPYSRGLHGPRAGATSLAAPVMMRAHSSPSVSTSGRPSASSIHGRPSSPSGSYRRYHSPSPRFLDESGKGFGGKSLTGIGETVLEESEAEHGSTSRDSSYTTGSAISSYQSHSFPRRYRSSSPLQQVLHPTTYVPGQSTSMSATSSPIRPLSRYDESYPASGHHLTVSFSSNSSMPSTPTSARSRSPSISSLETIPDSPDAEAAALEADRIAKLKAAADAMDDATSTLSPESRRRSYLDVSTGKWLKSGAFLSAPGSLASIYGSRDKRKRWSVCGAERRGDLDLETIWED